MVGVIIWALAVIAIHWVLKEPFKAGNKRINEHFLGRWDRSRRRSRLKKTYFVLAVFVTIVLLINLFLDFIDRYHSLFIVFCFIVYLIARSIYRHPNDIDSPKKQIKEFLTGRWKWFKSLPALKQAYLVVAGVIAFALFILFFRLYLEILLFDWGGTEITETTGNADSSIRNLAIAFLGTTSGIGALFGVYLAILRSEENTRQNEIAKSQADTAEQGLITDRINKAVESLGKFNQKGDSLLEVRIGALYALERIAQDSIRDHIQIMETLCVYIRHNSPLKKALEPIREDIQVAISIIGRRDKWTNGKKYLEKERERGYFLDLRLCNLYRALLANANLSNALLDNTSLNHADLTSANLSYAKLNGANLYEAELTDANLIYAKLVKANLGNCKLTNANMRCTNLDEAKIDNTFFMHTEMKGAYASKCNFSKTFPFARPKFNLMYCGADVIIPDEDERPEHWSKAATVLFESEYKRWLDRTYPALARNFKD